MNYYISVNHNFAGIALLLASSFSAVISVSLQFIDESGELNWPVAGGCWSSAIRLWLRSTAKSSKVLALAPLFR